MKYVRRTIGLLVVLSAVLFLAMAGLGVAAASAGDSAATDVDVSLDPANQTVDPGPPTVPGGQGPPQNLGITPDTYEDIDGDGSMTVFDVQTLFINMDSPVVNEHAAAFSFNNGDTTAVTIFDVQALFGLV